jgi:hypothetical protein
MNKAAFIKSLPTTMSAKEVAAKAKSAGLTLAEKYVYRIRSKMRAAQRTHGRVAQRGMSGPTSHIVTNRRQARSTGRSSGGTESTFRRLIFELGSERAHSLLKEFESKLSRLIEG